MQRFSIAWIALVLISSSIFSYGAQAAFNYADYALPQGPLRTYLQDHVRKETLVEDLSKIEGFSNKSNHWVIFKGPDSLPIFDGGQAAFIKAADPKVTKLGMIKILKLRDWSPNSVRTAEHFEGVIDRFGAFFHGPSQNLSRIVVAESIRTAIIEKNFQKIAPCPKKYVYHLSGDDAQLQDPNLNDSDVIVIAEMQNGVVRGYNQANRIDVDGFKELAVLVEQTGISDLHFGNIQFVGNKINFIDTEDVYNKARCEARNSWFPRLRLWLAHHDSRMVGLFTLLDCFPQEEGQQKRDVEGLKRIIKLKLFKHFVAAKSPYICSGGAILTMLAGGIRTLVYRSMEYRSIDRCVDGIKTALQSEPEADVADLVRKQVKKAYPRETREEVFVNFAKLVELGGEISLLSSEDKIMYKKLQKELYGYLSEEWGVCSKIKRGIMYSFQALKGFVANLTPSAATIAV